MFFLELYTCGITRHIRHTRHVEGIDSPIMAAFIEARRQPMQMQA